MLNIIPCCLHEILPTQWHNASHTQLNQHDLRTGRKSKQEYLTGFLKIPGPLYKLEHDFTPVSRKLAPHQPFFHILKHVTWSALHSQILYSLLSPAEVIERLYL